MVDATDALFLREQWLKVFLEHVVREVPDAPRDLLATKASALQALFGHFDPIDVAEAEWNDLPLGLEANVRSIPKRAEHKR